jgi:hypothetical protein
VKTGGWEMKSKKSVKKMVAFLAAGIMILSSLSMLTACTANSNADSTSQAVEQVTEEEMLTQKTYYELSNHSWRTDEGTYKYKLELSGELPNTNSRANFIVLANKEEIAFEEALAASGLSSSTQEYFKPEEAVIVALWVE